MFFFYKYAYATILHKNTNFYKKKRFHYIHEHTSFIMP